MHPRLVTCLLVSALGAAGAAGFVGFTGAGLLAVLLTYSCTGSIATLVLATLTMPGTARQPRPTKLLPPPAAPEPQPAG